MGSMVKALAVGMSTLAVWAVPAVALAHPGHGHTDGRSALHYVVEPLHAVVLVLGAVMMVAGAWSLVRWRSGARRAPARPGRRRPR